MMKATGKGNNIEFKVFRRHFMVDPSNYIYDLTKKNAVFIYH